MRRGVGNVRMLLSIVADREGFFALTGTMQRLFDEPNPLQYRL
jgi:hypothetical protein